MKPIESCPGYFADDLGRIFSTRSQRFLKPYECRSKTQHGYLCVNPHGIRKYVHRLVCEAFYGPCPPGMQCSHLDGNRTNNIPSNLLWESPKENTARKTGHNTHVGNAKLTALQYDEIRKRLKNGERQTQLAQEFNVSQSTISNIKLYITIPRRK